MQCLSASDPSEYIVFVSGTQLGKTECILNWTGEVIDLMPGPMAIVQSTLSSGEIFSKQRLQQMIDSTPCLFNKVAKAREREAGIGLRWLAEKWCLTPLWGVKNDGVLTL